MARRKDGNALTNNRITTCNRRDPTVPKCSDDIYATAPGTSGAQIRPELQNEAYGGWHSMTSFRQIEANRRNACKSTGPITEEGKQRSRCNAVRHGLTAETVIGALEDAEDYKTVYPGSIPGVASNKINNLADGKSEGAIHVSVSSAKSR